MHAGNNRKTRYTREKEANKHQNAYEIHPRTMKPAITPWMPKQMVISMEKQTAPPRQIHLPTQTRMRNIQRKWLRKWKTVRQSQQEPTVRKDNYEAPKNMKTPWILQYKNKHTQKLQEYIRNDEQPP